MNNKKKLKCVFVLKSASKDEHAESSARERRAESSLAGRVLCEHHHLFSMGDKSPVPASDDESQLEKRVFRFPSSLRGVCVFVVRDASHSKHIKLGTIHNGSIAPRGCYHWIYSTNKHKEHLMSKRERFFLLASPRPGVFGCVSWEQ